jgi:hypothetical protein
MPVGELADSDDENFIDGPRYNNSAPANRQASSASNRNVAEIPQDQQRAAALEGINSEAAKFLKQDTRNHMRWVKDLDRFREQNVSADWKAWGRIPDNPDEHLVLREKTLSWMACTSKILQTVDNKHMNRHLDYQYAGPTVNFVDVQTTPQIGRRLQTLAYFAQCINNFGEFPLDCVVPTPETELLFGQGKGCKLVRGMRMKVGIKRVSRELELTSTLRAAEKWLKNFDRGTTSTSHCYPLRNRLYPP